jgi:HEAT repeat protein
LRDAVKALERQRRQYARAATRGDGDALLVRVNGALARLGDSNAAERVAERGRTTAEQPCARGDRDDERAEALNALMQMSAENAMPILKTVLAKRDACSAELREKAVFLVSQKRTSETEDILLGVVRDDPSQEVKKKAVFWMGQVNTDRAAQALVTMLETSTTSSELREQADLRPDAAAERARPGWRYAESPRTTSRPASCARRRCSGSASSDRRRTRSICADCSTGSPEPGGEQQRSHPAEDPLLALADARRGERRVAAPGRDESEALGGDAQAGAVQRRSGGVSTAALSALYPRLTDRELKEHLIFVLSQKHDSDAVTRMIQIARSDPDRELRKKAIFWLGQSNDPRVKTSWSRLINGPR